MLHHMTPVAGGISDGKKDRFVESTSEFECFRSPRMPIHGIVGMLQQIRALLICKPVQSVFRLTGVFETCFALYHVIILSGLPTPKDQCQSGQENRCSIFTLHYLSPLRHCRDTFRRSLRLFRQSPHSSSSRGRYSSQGQ